MSLNFKYDLNQKCLKHLLHICFEEALHFYRASDCTLVGNGERAPPSLI